MPWSITRAVISFRAMRWIAVLLVLWTGVVLIGLLFVGPDVSTATGCVRIAGGPAECVARLTAVSDDQWRTQTLPRLVVAVAGYVFIDVYGIWALRARRRIAAW